MNILNQILFGKYQFSTLAVFIIDTLICLCIYLIILLSCKLLVKNKKNTVRFHLIRSTKIILNISIWAYLFETILNILVNKYFPNYAQAIINNTDKIFDFVIYLVIIINLFKFIKNAKQVCIDNQKANLNDKFNDNRDITAIFKAFQLLAVAISILLILAALQVPLTALSAFSGIILAGLTLSQATLLTNLFGGLFITFNRKFSEGDSIASDITSTTKFTGVIKKIGTLTTRVDNSDTSQMHIPNSIFLTTCITNISRRTHRKLLQFITIEYCNIDKISFIKDNIVRILKSNENIDLSKSLSVTLVSSGTMIGNKTEGSFGERGVNMQILAYVNNSPTIDFATTQDEILIEIAKLFKENNINFSMKPINLIDYNTKVTSL